MNVEILSIGTELLMGEIVDTNSGYLARHMPSLGLTVRSISQVADDVDELTDALGRALERADIVITTGGLGPTEDDLTRTAISNLLGEKLYTDQAQETILRTFLTARGREVSADNLRQAQRINSSSAIPNARGTAPGWWVENAKKIIISLPGPPHEMTAMWEKEVQPKLQKIVAGTVILSRTLKTLGIPEAAVNERVSHLFSQESISLGIYAKVDGVHLRIISQGNSLEEARSRIAPIEQEIRKVLGPSVWGVDDDTPEVQLGTLLQTYALTLATAESVTGGFLASRITDAPGSSVYFKGGSITYSSAMKIALGVPHGVIEEYGVVSPQVAEAMAEAIRQEMGVDLGIGITGVAGPAPLGSYSPGRVFIGLSFRGELQSVEGSYPPERRLVKQRAATQAILELCQFIRRHLNNPL